ncbi:MAG: methionine--tRNA ligase [Candidatus Zambryskibacteria bacterium]|nr:methionine--tRNA ligase [Candidatus Zambryskibacteria bacterium]
MSKNFYITTTLPYVNADPHIGFALEIVQADIIARFKRLLGHEVFFNFGTDEHGQKVLKAAEKNGLDPQAYTDQLALKFGDLKKILNLSYDNFVRTTDAHHIKAAQYIWKLADESGDIYKKKYRGLYCVSCERFIKESELRNNKCPEHPGKELEEVEEENYFFKFSKYQDKLLKYLNNPRVITPDWRRKEAINFVKNGLEDFPISRLKNRMSWGIPVPGDEDHVMYVWFDALTNYISSLGWPGDKNGNFKKFWQDGETLQFAGKDQVRFQSLMWQAMLMSAGLKNTDKVFYHGFINIRGEKISKSVGNTIDPFKIVEEFGTDALRYYLLAQVSPVEDSDFTFELFKEAYNANLANGLGNLTSRIIKMAEDNLEEPTEVSGENMPQELLNHLEKFELNKACNFIWSKISKLDGEIQEKKPWESKDKKVIKNLVLDLYRISKMLEPFMPETSEKIIQAIKENKKPEKPLFERK